LKKWISLATNALPGFFIQGEYFSKKP